MDATNRPPKPPTFNGDLGRLPYALEQVTAEPRWVVWRWAFQPERAKWTKVPYQPSRPEAKARSNDAATWGAYPDAVGCFQAGRADGIGFMLKDSDIAAFDIDDCRDTNTGEIAPWAWTLVEESNSYTEVTVSGTGLRIIGTAHGSHVHRNQPYRQTGSRVETYRRATRYIVVTGVWLKGSATSLANLDDMIDRVVAELDQAQCSSSSNKSERASTEQPQFDDDTSTAFLPEELRRLIRDGVPVGRRSSQFHHVVGWLKQLGYSVDRIETILAAHPQGIAQKYIGRLRQEIERCYGKTSSAKDQAGKREAGEAPGGDQPIPLRWHGDQDPYADRKWLIRDLVPETGKGLLPGQWGTGKTFIALDQSASVMTGEPFAGRPVDRRGGVLFIAPEGAYEIPIRLRGIVEGKIRGAALAQQAAGSKSVDPDNLPIAWAEECPRLVDEASFKKLAVTCQTAASHLGANFGLPLALIIVDTIAAGAGFADENAAAENQKVMSMLERLSHRSGAFVMGVDHFGKMVETGTRGSSAKEASADVVLAMLAERDVAGNISNTRMAVRKLRGGPTGSETPYSLDVIEIGKNRYDEPITTCIVNWNTKVVPPTATPKERWPKSLRIFQKAMQVALIDSGELFRPFGSEGVEVTAVSEAKVRAEFAAAYPVEGDTKEKRADAKKKAFTRALKSALQMELVISRDRGGVDHLWFSDDKDKGDIHTGDGRDTS